MKQALSSLAFLALAVPLAASSLSDGAHWPQWRGPLGTGESPDADPPVEWSEDKNVRWKVELPGKGKGTPIIFGDRIYLLAAEGVEDAAEAEGEVPAQDRMQGPGQEQQPGGRRRGRDGGTEESFPVQRFIVLALDRKDGSVVWKTVVKEEQPHEGTHGDGSWAAASAVTDGERLFAFFGSRGIFALDMQGKVLWEQDLGDMQTRRAFGEGSSPGLQGDTLVIQWDHEGPSFIVGLDAKTGKEKWRQERDEVTTWATPSFVEVAGRWQVLTNGTTRIRAYDMESGALVWECGGMTQNAIPSPVHDGATAYLLSGFRGSAALAIELAGAKGDITGTEAVRWSLDRDTPYVPSPLLVDGLLYFLKLNSGILSCLDAESGEQLIGPTRLSSVANVYASPVAAAGRVYIAGRDGDCEVIRQGPELELLATNNLEDGFDASPALAGRELYLRGARYLYCIAEDAE